MDEAIIRCSEFNIWFKGFSLIPLITALLIKMESPAISHFHKIKD